MMRPSVPGNRFSGSQSEKARGRGHCQAVRRLAAWFWEGWISWVGRRGETRRLTRLFPCSGEEIRERGLRRLVALNRFW